MKSHSGTKKRFNVTGGGKITYQKSGRRHILVNKSRKRMRALKRKGVITSAFQAHVKRLMPYA
jgi:large subunit ribosomal protein L35